MHVRRTSEQELLEQDLGGVRAVVQARQAFVSLGGQRDIIVACIIYQSV